MVVAKPTIFMSVPRIYNKMMQIAKEQYYQILQ
jgi:long-subunit acyl-CoA synthetase (AMP-forming)